MSYHSYHLPWSGVGGQLLSYRLLWSGVGGQLLSYHLLWSGVGGQLLSYHVGGQHCTSSLEAPFCGSFGKKRTRKGIMKVNITMMRMDTEHDVHEHDDADDDGDDDGSASDDNNTHAMLTIIQTMTVLTMMRTILVLTAIAI